MKKPLKKVTYSALEILTAIIVVIMAATFVSLGYTLIADHNKVTPTGNSAEIPPEIIPIDPPAPVPRPTPDPESDPEPTPDPEPQPEPEKDITEYAVGITSASGAYLSWDDLIEAGVITLDSEDETIVEYIDLNEVEADDAVFVFPDNITTLRSCSVCEEYNNDKIKAIYFSENSNLTTIEPYAIIGLTGLKKLYIPKSVEAIYGSPAIYAYKAEIILDPENAYYEYRADENVIMEKETHRLVWGYDNSTIPVDTLIIGCAAFATKNITEMYIPEGVTTIEQAAFAESNLVFIELPSTLTTIEDDAFGDCAKLFEVANKSSIVLTPESTDNGNITEHVITELLHQSGDYERVSKVVDDFLVIEQSGTKAVLGYVGTEKNITTPDVYNIIANKAFANLDIESITFSDDVTDIYPNACYYCTSLTEVNFGSNVTYIGDSAFVGTAIKEFVIPDTITELEWYFEDSDLVESITLPSGLTTMPGNYFSDMENLKTVVLPEGLTNISYHAFAGCTSLEEVYIPSTVTLFDGWAFANSSIKTITFAPNSQLTTIQSYAFENTPIQGFSVPASVNYISSSAFRNCTNVEFLSVDANNTTYDSRNNCNAILTTETSALVAACKNTVMPDTIGLYDVATIKALGIKTIVIPSGMTVQANAFKDYTALEHLIIKEGVTTIGNSAFEGCFRLKEINIPSTVTSIGNYAFKDCIMVESITVAAGNSTYDSRNNCNAIMKTSTNYVIAACINTVLPDDTYGIGQSAFEGLDITEIILPVSCSDISPNAFKNCKELVSIRYADGVESAVMFHIFDNAFFGCSKLEVIDIPQIAYNINTNVFLYCDSLTDIYYYNTVSNWQGRITSFTSGNGTGHTITVHCTDGDYIWN